MSDLVEINSENRVSSPNYQGRRRVAGFFTFPIFILLSGILVIPIILLNPLLAQNPAIMLPLTILCELLMLWGVTSWAWKDKGWKAGLLLKSTSRKNILVGALCGTAAYALLQQVAWWLSEAGFKLGNSDTSNALMETNGFTRVILFYLLVPLFVPFIEEMFFRGAIMHSLLESGFRRGGVIISVVASSLIFALAHFQGFSSFTDVFLLVWIFGVGAMNGLLAYRYNSLWPAVAAHVFYNGTTVIVSILAGILS